MIALIGLLPILQRLPATGWRWVLYVSACDADGSTFVCRVYRAGARESSGQSFTGTTPDRAIERALAWIRDARGGGAPSTTADATAPRVILGGGQGREPLFERDLGKIAWPTVVVALAVCMALLLAWGCS